ncbi:hypothetical protein [Pengzhenrongella sicca]|uniref:Uncharacterized protein n=1 Tax=Pengzhenrongella sicca TaxID=2819238 RepID=A0A8A4ZGU4_9MICO|nr:hypothetical protein [Pengzhenrongella sicca]QTE31104.1 hypothetical protein J4E96_09370 [Pengzhenrongella sicca]
MGDLLVPENFTVAMVDGVRVVLTRAALESEFAQFEWDGVRDAATDRRDLQWEREFDAWGRAVKVHGHDEAGPPPQMPGNLLARVQMVVSSENGEELKKLDGQVAGSGSEWHAEWRHALPAEGVKRLSLRFAVDGVPSAACQLHID